MHCNRVLLWCVAAGLVLAGAARADAPDPKPPERGLPAEAPGPTVAPAPHKAEAPATGKARRSAPSLRELSNMSFEDALEEARKAAGAIGAGPAEKEQLLALCLLARRNAEARALLAELAGKEASDAVKALAAAAARLEKEIKALPPRKKGENCSRQEAALRLQRAHVLLAGGRAAEAHAALSAIGPCKEDKDEQARLALLGLATWSGGEKAEAARLFDDLARKAGAGNDLAVRALNLVTSIQAYGVYKVRPGNVFRAGEELYAYCEVLNFDCRQHENGGYLTALDVDVCIEEPAPAGGGETGIAWQRREIDKVRHYTVSEIRDLHLAIRFPVPAKLDPRQTYWLKLVIRDPISGKSATSSLLKLEIAK